MRIIGGEARGRRLFAPQGMQTRPTADKVRESLFNILRFEVTDARVLDLFSGSGAMALEAVSRGAQSAVLVDMSRKAADAIRRNIELTRFEDRTRLMVCDWRRAVDQLPAQPFDLVFLDPPYHMLEAYDQAAHALLEKNLLAPGAILVMEHASECALTLTPPFRVYDERTYGAAGVSLVRREEA